MNIDFVIGDLTCAPFKSCSFGQIISFDTVEHIPDDDCAFKEFGRILKPSRKLILSASMVNVNQKGTANTMTRQNMKKSRTANITSTSSSSGSDVICLR